MVGQFVALITGIPDFFVRSNKISDAKNYLKFNFEQDWDDWAMAQVKSFGKDLYFEEPLSFEIVSRNLYFDDFKPDFKVEIDVNMGEFDRLVEIVGKVSVSFHLKLFKSYLGYLRNEMLGLNIKDVEKKREKLLENFTSMISNQVLKARKKFKTPLWTGPLEKLIAQELIGQIGDYKGDFFRYSSAELLEIPVYLNIAPFALKYIYFKNMAQSK
jgi:hypothetical protein